MPDEEIPQEYLDHLEDPPPGGEVEGESPPSQPPAAPPAEEDSLDFGSWESAGQEYRDYRLPRSEARQIAEFREWVRAHPEQAFAISQYLAGQYKLEPVAPPAPASAVGETAPPEEEEEVPPRVRQLEERLARTESELQNQQAVMARTALTRGQAAFAQDHGLAPADLEKVAARAQELNVLPGIAEQLKREGKADAVEAVKRTLEAAFWSMPEMREREVERARQQQKEQQAKGRKLAGISGTSGSVPREKPPSTPDEKRLAMIAEVAAAMGRGPEES